MKRALTLVAAVLVLFLGAPLSAPLQAYPIIDFEGLPSMPYQAGERIPGINQLSTQLLSTYGVAFSSGPSTATTGGYVAVVNLGAGHAPSGTQGIGGATSGGILTYGADNPISFSFFNPANPSQAAVTDSVSVTGDLWGTSGQAPLTLTAFDIDGNVIDTAVRPDLGGTVLTVSGAGIHRVQFTGFARPDGEDGIALDDLTFNPLTPIGGNGGGFVPEPSSIFLLGSMVVGGCAYARLRRKRRTEVA
jgi:hypothetical protein